MKMKFKYDDTIMIPANEFAQAATKWFELLKALPQTSWGIDELRCLYPQLAELVLLAYKLPKVQEFERDGEKFSIDYLEREISINEKYRYYYSLDYPYDGLGDDKEESDTPAFDDLTYDLYEICDDIGWGFYRYTSGKIYAAVWVWRALFLSNWGEHANHALYAMDHVIRCYMLDDDLGKHDDPKDAMYYPPVLLSDIDSSCILMLESEETGLPYDIIINSLGIHDDHTPMIGVILKKRVVFVEISNSPKNLSRKWFPEQKKVYEWIKYHYHELMSHWLLSISDKDLANMLTDGSEQ